MPQSFLLSVCTEDEGSDNLYFFSTNRKYYTNSQSFSLGCLSKAFTSVARQPEVMSFPIDIRLDPTKFVLLGVFTLIETIARKFEWNHFPRMRKVHYRLAFVAQKSLCLNSLKTISWHCRHDNVTSALRKAANRIQKKRDLKRIGEKRVIFPFPFPSIFLQFLEFSSLCPTTPQDMTGDAVHRLRSTKTDKS